MEYWVKSYISVQKFIELDRDDENNIIYGDFLKDNVISNFINSL